jgi:hypothetical protein
MNPLKLLATVTFLGLCVFQVNANAMDLKEHIKIESAKIYYEYNCTIDDTEESIPSKLKDPKELAQELTKLLAAPTPVTCTRPKYEYACFFPGNKDIPLSRNVSYPYWSNEPTLEGFKNSELGKKLHNCQAPWW